MPDDISISGLPVDTNISGFELVPIVDLTATPKNRNATIQTILALVTKTSLGLGNVNNTSDLNKPISTATAAALNGKAAAGPIGDSGLTMSPGLLGRGSGTGPPLVLTLGSGLSIVDGVLTVTGGVGGYPSLAMPTGFSVAGNGTASLTVAFAAGYSLPSLTSQADWNTAFTERRYWDGGSTGLNPATARASLELGTAAQSSTSAFAPATAPAAAVTAHEIAADPHPQYLTTAEGNAVYATAVQGALAATAVQPSGLASYVQTSDARLSDSREWSAPTVTQADAEAGISTVRRAWTVQRVWQAAEAWWQSSSGATGRAVAAAGTKAQGRTALELGSAATAAAGDFATAAQGAKADTAVQPAGLTSYVLTSDTRLGDAREWSAATATQAESEAGTSTARLAFTPQRVFQAIAAWWAGSAFASKLAGIASGATANQTDAFLLSRGNHTGTQTAGTITGLAAVATSGAYADLSGRLVISSNAPAALGATAAAGTSGDAARADHVHQRDTDIYKVPVGDESTAVTAGTNKIRFRADFTGTLIAVRAGVNTAPTGSTLIVDINKNGTSMLGAKLSIDPAETTSATAASGATITTSSIMDDDEIGIDIDQIGSTVAGAGLKVSLYVRRA